MIDYCAESEGRATVVRLTARGVLTSALGVNKVLSRWPPVLAAWANDAGL
ncbi:hypothetical protein [Erwinia sp.]|nr:hypothetical protein [Erwinia sp.]